MTKFFMRGELFSYFDGLLRSVKGAFIFIIALAVTQRTGSIFIPVAILLCLYGFKEQVCGVLDAVGTIDEYSQKQNDIVVF